MLEFHSTVRKVGAYWIGVIESRLSPTTGWEICGIACADDYGTLITNLNGELQGFRRDEQRIIEMLKAVLETKQRKKSATPESTPYIPPMSEMVH